MRRLILLVMAVLLIGCTVFGVYAATGASAVNTFATVSADGSCQVALTVTIRLEERLEKLSFPIPAEASGVTLNGSRVSAPKDGQVRRVQLGRVIKNITGEVTVSIHYTLRDVVTVNESGQLQLQLDLLSGFDYPVQALEFSVTLPGQPDSLPTFSSGYHKASIEKDLNFRVEGATVSGSSRKALKDHETLTLTMIVPEQLFPRAAVEIKDYQVVNLGMAVCAGLAVLYWLLALVSLPVERQNCVEPPQGFCAGQLGCVLATEGADLHLTVLSWAQLGYLTIRMDRKGRVTLYKRMEMGNERSAFERRTFQKLFGRNELVDTSGYRYAMLSREVGKAPAGIQELIHPRSGSGKIFRALMSGLGLFGGAGMGIALGNGAVLQWLLIVVLSVAGAVSGWLIQLWLTDLLLGRTGKGWRALILAGVWLLLGLMGEAFAISAWMVAGLLLAGILLFWSGRRTPEGKLIRGQVLSLRRYLRNPGKKNLEQICKEDPEYFFRMAPVALALGVDKRFASRFGKSRFSGCPYLSLEVDANMTATQWNEMLRRALAAMSSRASRLPLEKLLGFVKSVTRV